MVTIRPYNPSDAAVLFTLKRETIRRINSRDYSPQQIDAWAPADAAIDDWPLRVAGRFVVVAEVDGRIAGFGDVGPDGHIDQLFVSADHQRRGVGREIMNALVAEARRRRIERLTSDASLTAVPFFEAQCFAIETRQTVLANGVEFLNFRMTRRTS